MTFEIACGSANKIIGQLLSYCMPQDNGYLNVITALFKH